MLSIPFAWKHPAVDHQRLLDQDWFGSVQPAQSGIFIDYYLLLILGGIPYQVTETNCPWRPAMSWFVVTDKTWNISGLFPAGFKRQIVSTCSVAVVRCCRHLCFTLRTVHSTRRHCQIGRYVSTLQSASPCVLIVICRLGQWDQLRKKFDQCRSDETSFAACSPLLDTAGKYANEDQGH